MIYIYMKKKYINKYINGWLVKYFSSGPQKIKYKNIINKSIITYEKYK